MILSVLEYVLLIVVAITIVNAQTEFNDPSPQELALLDWTSGIRVAYCTNASVEKLAEPFRTTIAKSLNKFCRNATACSLYRPVDFTSEQIVLLDGYPRRDYGSAQFRFVVVLPHGAIPRTKIRQPLLTKEILSNFLRKYIDEISKRLGWKVLSYERFPKYDAITEFMNTALIPIGLFLLIFMFFLAYWSSTFSSSTGSSEAWMVTGASGGKNAAFRRTMEIIEEQKETQRELELEEQRIRKYGVDGPMSASMISTAKEVPSCKRPSEVLLDVSGLSSDSKSHHRETGLPEIVVVPSEYRPTMPRPSVASSRRYSRRLSSADEIMKEKRLRRLRNNPLGNRGPKRTWKSGSMALGGFGKS